MRNEELVDTPFNSSLLIPHSTLTKAISYRLLNIYFAADAVVAPDGVHVGAAFVEGHLALCLEV
jgi:predicted aspartyl protease